jgi:SAM domain (Sterile alpha motif)
MADSPRQWDVDRVRQWAEETFAFGATLAPRLVEHEVDGGVLLDWMDEERLKNDIGIMPLGQRVKILEKITELGRKTPYLAVDVVY